MVLQLPKYLSSGHASYKEELSIGEGYTTHLFKNHSNITCKSSTLHKTRKWYKHKLIDGNDGVFFRKKGFSEAFPFHLFRSNQTLNIANAKARQ